MKGTALGIWYRQSPNNYVINPLGQVITPKVHNRSAYVLVNRKRVAVSKLPLLNYTEAMEFKKIFVG